MNIINKDQNNDRLCEFYSTDLVECAILAHNDKYFQEPFLELGKCLQ